MAEEQPKTPDPGDDDGTEKAPPGPVHAALPEVKDAPADASDTLSGERCPPPRGPLSTAIMAVTGILLVLRGGRLLAKVVLRYRQPAEVRVTHEGVRVVTRTEMLGKVLRDQVFVIPTAGLLSGVRETRYPRVGMYTGLFALALGSYVGVGLVVDGMRAASLSMVGMGALLALFGLGVDFALASLFPGTTGRCRLVLVPRKGSALCIGSVDPVLADRLLARLSGL
jgi:hypothetical protein